MSLSDPRFEPAATETIVEMGRLNGLSDGVFAIALTLLVLEIGIPEGILEGELSATLWELGPKIFVYLISFIVVGGAWGSHQRMLSQIRRGDGVLVWLNLLVLLFVTLMPAGALVLGRYPGTLPGIVSFAVLVILLQIAALLFWRHAATNGLINPTLDPRVIDGIARRFSLNAAGFAVSMPLALFNPNLVYAVWVLLFLFMFTTDWLSWQQTVKTREEAIPLGDAEYADVRVGYSGGVLRILPKPHDGILMQGRFGGGVVPHFQQAGETLQLVLAKPARQGFMNWRYPWAWGAANMLDWTIRLDHQVPAALDLQFSGAEAELMLDELCVTNLKIKNTASSVNLTLPAHAGHMTVDIESSASSVVIHVPERVAVHVHATEAMGTAEVDLGRFAMVVNKREYKSPQFDSAPDRAEIRVALSLGSIKII